MSDDSTERTRLSSFCVQLTVHLSHGCRTVSLVGDVASRAILARAEVVQHIHQPFFLIPISRGVCHSFDVCDSRPCVLKLGLRLGVASRAVDSAKSVRSLRKSSSQPHGRAAIERMCSRFGKCLCEVVDSLIGGGTTLVRGQ